MTTHEEILRFWFDDVPETPFANIKRWWRKNPAFDEEIRDRFGALIKNARGGGLDNWKATPRGTLALIIILDQFSRNAFRNTPEAFAADERSLETSLSAIAAGFDYKLDLAGRCFFYMPLMHAEDLKIQEMSVQKFGVLAEAAPPKQKHNLESALDSAEKHRDIIAEFSRFPHRNIVLGRASSPAEVAFLERPGSKF